MVSEPPTHPPKPRRRLWITLGEAVAVLALLVAGLNYLDTRRQHDIAARQARARDQAESALVMTGEASADGRRVTLQPLNPAQAVQSQRYIFPKDVLTHEMEVAAAKPQIDLGWIDDGLKRVLNAAHAPRDGEADVPVGVVTTYVQAADTYTDRSVYRLGYRYRSGFLGGRTLMLQGLSLQRRAVAGNLQARVDAYWSAERPPGRDF